MLQGLPIPLPGVALGAEDSDGTMSSSWPVVQFLQIDARSRLLPRDHQSPSHFLL
jgi:hypothetical protein